MKNHEKQLFSALFQIKSLKRFLRKDPILKEQFSATLPDDLSKSYIVKVEKFTCLKNNQPREWYLPHPPVFHPHERGKVRPALKGATKFHYHSLHNAYLTGPDLLQNFIHVLLCFRKHPYAVYADVEGFFRQVGVIPKDQ